MKKSEIVEEKLSYERTVLSGERTMLSYFRTALAALFFGIAIMNLFKTPFGFYAGGVFIIAGIVFFILGFFYVPIRNRKNFKKILK